MKTFKDYDTDELVRFESVKELILSTDENFETGAVSAYIVEVNGIPHRVTESFYKKVAEEKGL